MNYNLDCAAPDEVPGVLESVADHYRASAAELTATWQDNAAGEVWSDFAVILDRAAAACRKSIRNRLG